MLINIIILFIEIIALFTIALLYNRSEKVKVSDIKIKYYFKKTPPHKEKMRAKEQFYKYTGCFESAIILDKNNKLIDGYTSYLLAKKYKIKKVKIIREEK